MPGRLNHIGIPARALHQIALDGVAGDIAISIRVKTPMITITQPGEIRPHDPQGAINIRAKRRHCRLRGRTLPRLVYSSTNHNQSAQQNEETENSHKGSSDIPNYNA